MTLPSKAAAICLLVMVAQSTQAADLLPGDRPIAEVIDHYIDGQLKAAGVTPAPQADDATIVRRLMLDLAGRIPTAEEAQQYVASTDPRKRSQLVDRLITSPWFVRHSATEFNLMLRGVDGDGPDLRGYLLFAVAELRPLTPMQFGMSVLMLGSSDFASPQDASSQDMDALTKKIEELEGSAGGTFGPIIDRPQLGLQINVNEPLGMSNDPGRISAITSRLVPQLMKLDDPHQQIDLAVWSILGRPPTSQEVELLTRYLADHSTLSADERARIEQAAAAHRAEVMRAEVRAAEIEAELKTLDDADSVLPPGSDGWKYVAAAGLSGDDWLRTDFDDGSWTAARTPAGYGQPFIAEKGGTTLELKELDIAFRREFQLDGTRLAAGKGFKLRIASDDSAAVWINGKLVDDEKAVHDAVNWNRDLELPGGVLVAGRNVVAVRIRNAKGSPDAVLDLQIAQPNPDSLVKRDKLTAELNETRKLAAAPVAAAPTDADLARKAREHMVWALVAGPEFRFNH